MFKENKKDKRFITIEKEGSLSEGTKIIVDTKTGVNYLYSWQGYSGGITPLLDCEGKAIINFDDIVKE